MLCWNHWRIFGIELSLQTSAGVKVFTTKKCPGCAFDWFILHNKRRILITIIVFIFLPKKCFPLVLLFFFFFLFPRNVFSQLVNVLIPHILSIFQKLSQILLLNYIALHSLQELLPNRMVKLVNTDDFFIELDTWIIFSIEPLAAVSPFNLFKEFFQACICIFFFVLLFISPCENSFCDHFLVVNFLFIKLCHLVDSLTDLHSRV